MANTTLSNGWLGDLKAYLSHSFNQGHQYWNPTAAKTVYRDMIRRRILTDRSISILALLRTGNSERFRQTWGQDALTLPILKGPLCLMQDPLNDQ
ncbi:hypothetical protein PAAG_12410 [Paracoccidioides lutzii Pb01]|uniref:Uncharacterized protein n=1 Tax=Paracoccidioides lutzii (strain ATCC MYA-826 / Pb01) TaxID=502779 RepID=A0A0A2V3F0_PARBA|nr:hypothetical protein PAAG_12410 [Paracoccidioides lutzii Pb01]KGQ00907.1 hypothetical protein PAAG_12410 [Paracoccidioides lutzii Pb01]